MAVIDLHGCNDRIKDPVEIKRFIKELVNVIDMIAHGDTLIDRFGEGGIEGYSAFQFIETSSIVFHNDERDNSAYIDIFSCKDFDEEKARRFCQDFFSSIDYRLKIIER